MAIFSKNMAILINLPIDYVNSICNINFEKKEDKQVIIIILRHFAFAIIY